MNETKSLLTIKTQYTFPQVEKKKEKEEEKRNLLCTWKITLDLHKSTHQPYIKLNL